MKTQSSPISAAAVPRRTAPGLRTAVRLATAAGGLLCLCTFPRAMEAALPGAPNWTVESNQTFAELGATVSTAGDVNGDGFSDVIVGVPNYDNGELDEGRALVCLGSSAGLATTPAWTAESNTAGAYFGHSVATAGDVNGDGFDDIVVGAWSYTNGQPDEGRAFLYLGSPSGPSPTPAWTWEPNQDNARCGSAVSTAGDVNGDGYDDVLIGAMWYSNGSASEGAVFLFLGGPGGLGAAPVWTAEGNLADAWFGYSLSTAGDVNGDGFADVIIGAPRYANPQSSEGRVFAFYGSPAGLPAMASWWREGEQVEARFGTSVGLAGDTNGDGYSDVIVGAPGYDQGQTDEGMAFVYLGSSTGLPASPVWTIEGNQPDAQCGSSVFTAGDVNGDGRADVAVGVIGYTSGQASEGRVIVCFGLPSGPSTSANWTAESNQAGAWLGNAVGTAGDVNGDGFGDLLAAAPYYDNGQEDEGRAFAYYGAGDGILAFGWQAESNVVSAWYGRCVSPAGDVNADGYNDLAVSAYKLAAPESNEGRVYVYHGSATGVPVAANWQVESNQADAFFGTSVAAAGDVNGDGYGDLLVGAPAYDHGQADEGTAFLYLGSTAGLLSSSSWTCEGDMNDAALGYAVSGAGDVNGDGYADVIVGAPGYTGGGAAFLYLGSSSGLAASPARTLTSGQAGGQFGNAVACAGDVNRDGYSDVIVAAPRYDNGQTDEGRVFVYLGSIEGVGSSFSWSAEGNQASAQFGFSVAGAGDVNGDGYGDIIIGANAYDNGQTDEGRVFVYHGSASGLSVASAWTAESDQLQGALGVSVGGLGDVNLDGYSDIACGASLYSSGELQEGNARVYHGSPTGLAASPAWTGEGNQVQCFFGLSVCGPGDVNGDGFADLAAGAPSYDNGQLDEGRAFVYLGSGMPGGMTVLPRQWKTGGGLIELLGASDDCCSFRLRTLLRTAYGRSKVRMQWCSADLSVSLASSAIEAGLLLDTGTPVAGEGSRIMRSELVDDATGDRPWHWRLRAAAASPFFPQTPWVTVARSVPSEKQLRIGPPNCAVPAPGSGEAALWLAPPEPNPLRTAAVLRFGLSDGGAVRLTIHDAAGRRVAVLVDGQRPPGEHTAIWSGRGSNGSRVPAGLYFARLETGGRSAACRIVMLP